MRLDSCGPLGERGAVMADTVGPRRGRKVTVQALSRGMSTFRLTTIERAYELARSGACRTVGEIKARLQAEGYEGVKDRLYGASMTGALRKLCAENYVAPEGEEDAPARKASDDDDD